MTLTDAAERLTERLVAAGGTVTADGTEGLRLTGLEACEIGIIADLTDATLYELSTLVGIGAAITGLEVYRWDVRTAKDIAAFDPLVYSLAGINIAQMPVVVLGLLVMTSEYTTGLIRLCQQLPAPKNAC